jgi:hypothetical protein
MSVSSDSANPFYVRLHSDGGNTPTQVNIGIEYIIPEITLFNQASIDRYMLIDYKIVMEGSSVLVADFQIKISQLGVSSDFDIEITGTWHSGAVESKTLTLAVDSKDYLMMFLRYSQAPTRVDGTKKILLGFTFSHGNLRNQVFFEDILTHVNVFNDKFKSAVFHQCKLISDDSICPASANFKFFFMSISANSGYYPRELMPDAYYTLVDSTQGDRCWEFYPPNQ